MNKKQASQLGAGIGAFGHLLPFPGAGFVTTAAGSVIGGMFGSDPKPKRKKTNASSSLGGTDPDRWNPRGNQFKMNQDNYFANNVINDFRENDYYNNLKFEDPLSNSPNHSIFSDVIYKEPVNKNTVGEKPIYPVANVEDEMIYEDMGNFQIDAIENMKPAQLMPDPARLNQEFYGDTEIGQQAISNGFGEMPVGEASSFGSGFLEGAGKVAPYAGALMNIYQGLFGKTDVPDAPQMSYQPALDMTTDIDVTDQIDRNMSTVRTILADPNASSAQKRAAMAQKMQMDNQVYSTERNTELQLENQQRAEINKISAQNNAMDAKYDDYEMRADANKTNMLTSGLSQLATTYQKTDLMNMMQERDMQGLKMYMDTLQTQAEKDAFIKTLKESGIEIDGY